MGSSRLSKAEFDNLWGPLRKSRPGGRECWDLEGIRERDEAFVLLFEDEDSLSNEPDVGLTTSQSKVVREILKRQSASSHGPASALRALRELAMKDGIAAAERGDWSTAAEDLEAISMNSGDFFAMGLARCLRGLESYERRQYRWAAGCLDEGLALLGPEHVASFCWLFAKLAPGAVKYEVRKGCSVRLWLELDDGQTMHVMLEFVHGDLLSESPDLPRPVLTSRTVGGYAREVGLESLVLALSRGKPCSGAA